MATDRRWRTGAVLATLEMRRAKVRFLLLTAALGLLAFLIFFQQTLLTNLLGSFTGALEHQSAEVVVYGEDARRNLAGSVVTPEQVVAVQDVTGVEQAEPFGEATFTIRTTSGETVDGILFGYVLEGPGAPTRLSAGRLPRGPGEGVASSIDAENGFGLGATVDIIPGDSRAQPLPVRVVGLADDSRFSVQPVLFTAYETFEQARLVANPDARAVYPSAVAVEPEPQISPTALARRIDRNVAGVEALDRETAVRSLPGVQAVTQSFSTIILLTFAVVVLVAGFFFLILTVQKTTALTVLRATGVPAGELVFALLIQVLTVTIGGIFVGLALLAIASLGSSPAFPIALDPREITVSALLVLVLAVLGSAVSARRVARVDPLDAVTTPALGGIT